MKALVIGEGTLGLALIEALDAAGHHVTGTSRDVLTDKIYLNMTNPIPPLPNVDVVYICAAVASYRKCEGDQSVWVINADAPVAIVRQCIDSGMFPVFVSTDAIEFMTNAYTRMKAYAESCIIPMGGAVVRPTRFTPETVNGLCRLMIRVGLDRKPGVYRWPS